MRFNNQGYPMKSRVFGTEEFGYRYRDGSDCVFTL